MLWLLHDNCGMLALAPPTHEPHTRHMYTYEYMLIYTFPHVDVETTYLPLNARHDIRTRHISRVVAFSLNDSCTYICYSQSNSCRDFDWTLRRLYICACWIIRCDVVIGVFNDYLEFIHDGALPCVCRVSPAFSHSLMYNWLVSCLFEKLAGHLRLTTHTLPHRC